MTPSQRHALLQFMAQGDMEAYREDYESFMDLIINGGPGHGTLSDAELLGRALLDYDINATHREIDGVLLLHDVNGEEIGDTPPYGMRTA